MRDTFKSNLVSAITSEKSSLESYNVFMKVNNDEHAKMKASIEDKEKIMAVAFPPTAPFCDIEKDYKRLQKVLFTTEAVTKPIPLQRSMCAIMSSLKFM